MKTITFCCCIFLSLVSGAQSPFTLFRQDLQADNFSRAQKILDSCSVARYHEDSILYYKGLLILKKGNIRGAKIHAENLKKTYPAFTEIHHLNGLISFAEEDYGNSIKEFTELISITPTHAKAIYNRSVAYGQLEDFPAAIDDLTTCIRLDSTNAAAYYSRAYWHEASKNLVEAQKDYEKTIQLEPKNYDAYLGLAYIYQNQKDYTKACDAVNRAIAAGSQIAESVRDNFCR